MDSDAEIENHVRTDFTSAKDCQAVLHNWPRWLWLWGRWFGGFPLIKDINKSNLY
jgi:hypothetical protein